MVDFLASNNKGEYDAILTGMRMAIVIQVKFLEVFNDSKVVVDQVNGLMLTKDARMIAYKALVLEMANKFENIVSVNVLREKNSKADQFEVGVSQLRPRMSRNILVELLIATSILMSGLVQILGIQHQTSWMTLFRKYLLEGVLPADKREAIRLKAKAYYYYIHDGNMYRKGKREPNLKCLTEAKFQKVLKELYQGVCGLLLGDRLLVHKAMM